MCPGSGMSYKSERSFERSMIPHEYIEELTRRTDIVELVGSYVQLKRKGRLYGGLCPFHSEKTPSFYVYPDTQSFYCFGCGVGGDVIHFVRRINSIDYTEAVKMLAARAGMPEPQSPDHRSFFCNGIICCNCKHKSNDDDQNIQQHLHHSLITAHIFTGKLNRLITVTWNKCLKADFII